jgi:hypothetical protein
MASFLSPTFRRTIPRAPSTLRALHGSTIRPGYSATGGGSHPASGKHMLSATQHSPRYQDYPPSQTPEHELANQDSIKSNQIEPGINKTFSRFDMAGNAVLVTGGSQGLGLGMAEGLAEAGARVYCLDRNPDPSQHFEVARDRLLPYDGGNLEYKHADITDTAALEKAIEEIADTHKRLDGVIAAAGIQKIIPAIEYSVEDAKKMLDVNFTVRLFSDLCSC